MRAQVRLMGEWIDAGLSLVSRRRRRLRGMRRLVTEYEAEHGSFTDDELEALRARNLAAAEAVRTEAHERAASREPRT